MKLTNIDNQKKFIILSISFFIRLHSVESSFIGLPEEINYKIVSHVQISEDFLSLRLVSRLSLQNAYSLVKSQFVFLDEKNMILFVFFLFE